MEIIIKNKKPTKIGDSRGFIVDAAYFKNEQLSMDEEYDIIIKEAERGD